MSKVADVFVGDAGTVLVQFSVRTLEEIPEGLTRYDRLDTNESDKLKSESEEGRQAERLVNQKSTSPALLLAALERAGYKLVRGWFRWRDDKGTGGYFQIRFYFVPKAEVAEEPSVEVVQAFRAMCARWWRFRAYRNAVEGGTKVSLNFEFPDQGASFGAAVHSSAKPGHLAVWRN